MDPLVARISIHRPHIARHLECTNGNQGSSTDRTPRVRASVIIASILDWTPTEVQAAQAVDQDHVHTATIDVAIDDHVTNGTCDPIDATMVKDPVPVPVQCPPGRRLPPPPAAAPQHQKRQRPCYREQIPMQRAVTKRPRPPMVNNRGHTNHCERYLPEEPEWFSTVNAEREWCEYVLFVLRLDIHDEQLRRTYWNNRILRYQESWRSPLACRCDVQHILTNETEWLKQELIRLDVRLRNYHGTEQYYIDRITRLHGMTNGHTMVNGHSTRRLDREQDHRATLRINERIMRDVHAMETRWEMELQEEALSLSRSGGASDSYAT